MKRGQEQMGAESGKTPVRPLRDVHRDYSISRNDPRDRSVSAMPEEDTLVAVFGDTTDAGQAVNRLRQSGIDLSLLSVVGRSFLNLEQPCGFYSTHNAPRYLGRAIEFWESLWGASGCEA